MPMSSEPAPQRPLRVVRAETRATTGVRINANPFSIRKASEVFSGVKPWIAESLMLVS